MAAEVDKLPVGLPAKLTQTASGIAAGLPPVPEPGVEKVSGEEKGVLLPPPGRVRPRAAHLAALLALFVGSVALAFAALLPADAETAQTQVLAAITPEETLAPSPGEQTPPLLNPDPEPLPVGAGKVTAKLAGLDLPAVPASALPAFPWDRIAAGSSAPRATGQKTKEKPASPQDPAPKPPPAVAAAARKAPNKSAEAVLARLNSKRRSHLTDIEVRRQLLLVPELNLEGVPGTTKALVDQHQAIHGTGVDLTPALIGSRADLFGLRPRSGGEARLNREEAMNMHVLSQLLRRNLERSIPGAFRGVVDLRIDSERLRELLFNDDVRATWIRPEAVPALRQLLMHERKEVRLLLVEALDLIKGPGASTALVGKSLFDLHPDERAAALVALKGRPHWE
jgi:hypothetical protein